MQTVGNKLLFVVNPYAGKGIKDKKIEKIIDIFEDDGWNVTLYKTVARADATRKVAEAVKDFDRIVCLGGDGTLNEVICGVMQSEKTVPVGYIPAGSANDLGSSIGLPKNNIKAAKIVSKGTVREHDIASFTDKNGSKTFVYIASFGAFTEVSWGTSQKIKKALGHSAYMLESIKAVFNIRATHTHIETDSRVFDGEYIFCAVANTLRTGGVYHFKQTEVDMSDGLLELVLISKPAVYQVPRLLTRLFSHKFNNVDITFIHTKKAVFSFPDGDAPIFTLDGERADPTGDITVECIHGKVKLVY